MTLHVYRVKAQPATRYTIDLGVHGQHTFEIKPRAPIWTHCCKRRRYARNLVVHVYYDGNYFFCVPGHGCKRGKR